MSAPTDDYGWAAAMATAVQMYIEGGRRSGKTTALVDRLQTGDRVICATRNAARELERRIQVAKKDGIAVLVSEPGRTLDLLRNRGQNLAAGRTHFDHGWVEQLYENAITSAAGHYQMIRTEFDNATRPPARPVEPPRLSRRMKASFPWGDT